VTDDKGDVLQEIDSVLQRARSAVGRVADLESLESLRVSYLGKKGKLTAILRGVGSLPDAVRPKVGAAANQARAALEALIDDRRGELRRIERERRLGAEALDVTLPGRRPPVGHRHPLSTVIEEIERIFVQMGFEVATGPEVELETYNFELLNMPREHPARDMQDSFYVTDDILLRTHTSPVQIRYMLERAPELPVRIIVPGRVFRRDDDPSHSPMFHQVEGLAVDRGITMGDLKGVLLEFARALFGDIARIRLRPSYFPFTEPSCEVDVSCTVCGGVGCQTCGGGGWMEILGAGMVHPQVLRNGGYDPEEVSGFAFGMGPDRIAMLKHGIDDIRVLFTNDKRFLEQF